MNGVLALAALSGCETCPPALDVTLGNGSVQTASANTGQASQANTVWAFFADSPLAPLSLLSPVIAHPPGFIFRAEFGASGEILRVFDNEVIVPDTLGREILLDAILRPAMSPFLFYVAESYGAEQDSSVGVTTCGLVYFGPFQAVKARIEFAGTTNDLLGRSDGTLTFITEPNPLLVLLGISPIGPERVEIEAFATREVPPIVPLP